MTIRVQINNHVVETSKEAAGALASFLESKGWVVVDLIAEMKTIVLFDEI